MKNHNQILRFWNKFLTDFYKDRYVFGQIDEDERKFFLDRFRQKATPGEEAPKTIGSGYNYREMAYIVKPLSIKKTGEIRCGTRDVNLSNYAFESAFQRLGNHV